VEATSGAHEINVPDIEPKATQPSKPPLKGSVHGIHLLEQGMLGRIGNTTETIKKICLIVMNELAMPQNVTGTSPNVVGTTVIQPFPSPSGVMYIGHEDPHMKAASSAINMLIEHAKRLEDEISTTVVPAETTEYAKELWDKIREISEKLYADLNDLATLARSKGAEYETTKMEKLAVRIYDKSEAINKLRRRIAEELRKNK